MSGGRREGLERTEQEIRAEKAAALGRAGECLEAALAQVARLAAALGAAQEPAARQPLEREYDAAWRRAASARLALLIQREAVGLRHHRIVDQQFPEPPRRPARSTPGSRHSVR